MSWDSFPMKTSPADKLFSLIIRFRDKWTCQVCFWPADEDDPEDRYRLDNSHFFGRGNLSTRFDRDNCMAACKRCHTGLGGPRDERYQAIMARRLGVKGFNLLWLRGHSNGEAPDEKLLKIVLAEDLRKMGVNPRTGRRIARALSGPGIVV